MSDKIYVIFDGPPTDDAPRFIDVHNLLGESVGGSPAFELWTEITGPGGSYWQLGPFYETDYSDDLKEAEAKIERLIKAGNELAMFVQYGNLYGNLPEDWENAKNG